jgi:hypothetical protein
MFYPFFINLLDIFVATKKTYSMRSLLALSVTVVILSLMGCKTTQPTRPLENYTNDDRFANQPSTIRIPVRLNIKELENSLNQQLGDALYQDDSFNDGDKMKVIARKDGTIKITTEGSTINYQVPLDLWIQYDLGLGKVEATGRLNLDFSTVYAIGSDWKLGTRTSLQSHEWKERPRLKMGGVSIPVQSIANLILSRSTATISNNIDTLVASSFKLDETVAEAWELMFNPYEISPEYQTWLLVNPTDLGMTPIKTENGNMEATIIVKSKPELRFGPKPSANPVIRLPNFEYRMLNESAEEGFQIFLDATLPYEEAERLTQQSIKGERFEQGNRYVVVEDIELFGQGNNLVINLLLSGSYNGHIYLTGEPVFNPGRNRIEVEDLEYTLDSKNFLLRSAAWLAKGTLKKKLQDNMDYLMDYNLTDAQKQMQEQLQDYEISQGVKLKGALEELNIYNAYLTTDGIKVVMSLKGDLGVIVDGLSDFGK